MKTPMNEKILAVIDMIQSERRVMSILHNEILCDKHNYIEDIKNFYNSIPLPEGMNISNACFEAVLCYQLTDEIMKTEYKYLSKFEFGF